MTKDQIQKMKHCLGIVWSASGKETEPNKTYRTALKSNRNHFQHPKDSDWEDLATKGYASRGEAIGTPYYYVTEEGKDALRELGYIFN